VAQPHTCVRGARARQRFTPIVWGEAGCRRMQKVHTWDLRREFCLFFKLEDCLKLEVAFCLIPLIILIVVTFN